MQNVTKLYAIACANSTVQVLPETATQVTAAWIASTASLAGVGIMISLTPVSSVVGTTQIQFTGTAVTPSSVLTLSYSPTTNELLLVSAVPVGQQGGAA